MCVVSNIGDMGREMWPEPFKQPFKPWAQPLVPSVPYDTLPGQTIPISPTPYYNGPTREQFEEFLKLLRAAKRFDTLLGMKDCEMAEKLEWLKAIAAYLGVDVKDLVE